MTIVDSMIKIAEWLNNGVCTKFKFKVPPEEGTPVNDRYEYQEIAPHAFPVFLPAKDKMPPDVKTNVPSIIVQLANGEDNKIEANRMLMINLAISCWNPGRHSKDIYYPQGKETETFEKYVSTYDGWMDAWNFADAVLRELESTIDISGLKIGSKISFGAYKEQEAIVDCYPFWYAWIQFSVQSEFMRNNQYHEFL